MPQAGCTAGDAPGCHRAAVAQAIPGWVLAAEVPGDLLSDGSRCRWQISSLKVEDFRSLQHERGGDLVLGADMTVEQRCKGAMTANTLRFGGLPESRLMMLLTWGSHQTSCLL